MKKQTNHLLKKAIYKNKNKEGKWAEYVVTSFEVNKSFIFHLKGGRYHVRYTFQPISNNSTKLEYYEWVDEGNLEKPFTIEVLEKLKSVVEN